MLRLKRNKKSKFIVYIGYAMKIYCDNKNDVESIINNYGKEKCNVEKVEEN